MGDNFMDMLSDTDDPEEQGNVADKGMADLLGSLMGGGGSGEAGGLGDLLGSLMGGGSAANPTGGESSDMMGMLGGLLGGAPSGGAASSGDAGDMMGMLGGLMGGGATESAGSGAADAGGLGGLLGGLLGGGGAGGLGGLLGGLMGGGGAPSTFGGGGGAMLPFADTLAEKLGISPQMANTLIMGAIGLLTASMAKKQSGRSVGLADMTDSDYIRSSGMASRLSSQMGISEDDAIYGLQQAMGLMATQAGATAKPTKPAAKKTTARKATSDPAAPKPAKKTTRKTSKTTPKKKSSTSDTGSDFMDLLDDPR